MQLFFIRDKKTKGEITCEGALLRCNNVPALCFLVKASREKIRRIRWEQGSCISHELEIVNADTREVVETIPRQED